MLSCPIAVCVQVHIVRECVVSITHFARVTCQVSRDAHHVHLVAVNGTSDLSCCFLHAVRDDGTLLAHVQQLSHGCPVHGSFLVLFTQWSRSGSRILQTKHDQHVSDVLRICLNRVSTSRSHRSLCQERKIDRPDGPFVPQFAS